MPWIQLKLNTTGANAEELSDALMEVGSVSITFQDTHDTPVFEPLPGETRLWGDTDVIGLFDAETDMKEVVAILENHPLLGAGFVHKIEQLEDKDWEREWMDNFHPMQFGKRLWICPSWRDVPDANAVNVMLDPGLAFGTGTHPTTSLCLAMAGWTGSGRENGDRFWLWIRDPRHCRTETRRSKSDRDRHRSASDSGQPR